MQSLQQVLESRYGLAAALVGWKLTGAADISADGKTIVGDGMNPSGQREGFVIVVPEPMSAAVGWIVLFCGRRSVRHPRKKCLA